MTLLVTADAVATRLSIPLPLSAAVQARIEDAIYESQGKVQSYLNRTSLDATQATATAIYPNDQFPLTDARAWPQAVRAYDDRCRVVSYVVHVEPDGTSPDPDCYDVTFAVGLDVANDPELDPILRFIKADAAEGLRLDAAFSTAAGIQRVVTSVSAGGQSVSYDKGSGNADAAGFGLTLSSLKRWKRLSIRQANHRVQPPFPYAYQDRSRTW